MSTLELGRRTFIGAAALAVAGSPASAAPAAPSTAPTPALRPPAPASAAERALRYGRARELMRRLSLAAILIGVAEDDYEAAEYFTGPIGGQVYPVVCLPLEGEPFAFGPADVSALRAASVVADGERAGATPWITRWRFGHDGVPKLVEDMRAAGLGRGRIGGVNVVGYDFGDYLAQALPEARFVDVAAELLPLRAALSAESQQAVRAAAAYAEHAAGALVAAARIGIDEPALAFAPRRAVVANGGLIADVALSGPNGLGGRYTPPRLRDFQNLGRLYDAGWRQRGLPPPTLKAGDLITTELHCWAGPMQAHAQATLAFGRPSARRRQMFAAARRAYEAGLAAARPGATLAQVAAAMKAALPAGAVVLEPQVRGLNPALAFAATDQAPGAFQDLVLAEGMHLQLKPNLRLDGDYVGIGGGVLVGAAAPIQLNAVPLSVHLVEA